MDPKVQKLIERALAENLTDARVADIMYINGYQQDAIDLAIAELKKKRPAEPSPSASAPEPEVSTESPSVGAQPQPQQSAASALPVGAPGAQVQIPAELARTLSNYAKGTLAYNTGSDVTDPQELAAKNAEFQRKLAAGEVREPGGSVLLKMWAEEDRQKARELKEIQDQAEEGQMLQRGVVYTDATLAQTKKNYEAQQQEKRKQANEAINEKLGGNFNMYEPDASGNLVANPEKQKLFNDYVTGLNDQAEFRINQFIVDEAKEKAQVNPVLMPYTTNLFQSIMNVGVQTVSMIGEATGLQDEATGDYISEQVRQNRLNNLYSAGVNPEMGVTESLQNGDVDNAMKQIMFAGTDFVPQIAAMIANPIAGMAYAGAGATSSTYDQYRNRMDLTATDKVLLAGGAGVIELAMERLGIGDIKMARKLLGITAEEVGTQVAKKKVLNYLTPLTKGFLPEFAEEGGVSVLNQALAAKIAGEDFSWRNVMDEALIGGVFGGTTVAVPQVLAAGANGMASRGRLKEFREVTDRIGAINDALANTEITQKEKDILTQELVDLGMRQTAITNSSIEVYRGLDEKSQQELRQVHSDLNSAMELYNTATDKTAKALALRSVKQALDTKAEIEARYDSKAQTGLRGSKQEGDFVGQVSKPGTGTKKTSPSGVVQTPQTEVDPKFYQPTFEVDGQGRVIFADPAKNDSEEFMLGGVRPTSKLSEENASVLNRIFNVVSKVSEGAKVVVHHSLESLLNSKAAAAQMYVDGRGTPKAYYDPNTNQFHVMSLEAYNNYNDGAGTNIEGVKQYMHEMAHPVLDQLIEADAEVKERLFNEIVSLKDAGNAVADRAVRFGKGYADAKQQTETIVEFFALMGDPKRLETLDTTLVQRIKNVLNEIMAKLGFDIKLDTDQDVVTMARNLSLAMKTGNTVVVTKSNIAYQKRSVEYSMDEGTTPAGSRLFNTPLEGVQQIVQNYVQKAGIEYRPGKNIYTINEERAKMIGQAYDRMKHDPNNPEVKAAYDAMAKETIAQYETILEQGYVVEINNTEPYANSAAMIADLSENKVMKIFSTESGFGDTPITDDQRAENPLLRDSGFKDVNGQTLLVNDVFRFVHDFFGHAERGNSFGAKGEENAWDAHSRMYTPLARKAMTSETRGQNSWVNFSGVNDEAFKLRDKARALRKEGRTDEAAALVEKVYEVMRFADQKIGLLPDEFVRNDYDEVEFSLDDVKGTEKVVSGKVANTVINKAKRTQAKSLSVNDIDYGNLSTTAQPIGLAKKILGGSFSYKKQGKVVELPLAIKNTERLKKIDRLVDKVRTATGSQKTAFKQALGVEVEAAMMDIKDFMKSNIRVLYNSLTPEFVAKSKQWYDGANRIAQQLASDYSVTLEQASGILAALSPQNDWFNNITNANHVMDIMSKERNTQLDDKIIADAVEYSNSKSTKPGDSEFSQRLKSLYAEIGSVSISDLEALEAANNADYGIAKANIVRAISLAKMSQENKTIDPEGNVVGTYAMPHTWMTDNVIVNAINIFTNGSPEVISSSLGDGNKVRNFYNNIVDPNSSEEYLTADTHALAVALASPISAADAGGFGLFGGNESITYAIVKDAYIEVANEVGILPRQLQSVTWEAVRTGVNNPARPKKKETLKLIQQLSNTNLPYEDRAIQIIQLNPSFTPEWAVKRGITAQKETSGLRPTNQQAIDAGVGGVSPSRGSGLGGVRGGDSRVGQNLTGEVDFSIDWYESPEGKGDPAISRRDAQLEEAAQDLLAGRIKNYEFREMAKGLSPIEPITRFFAPATQERMATALSKDKVPSLNAPVAEGQVVALRLDIPAYTSSNTWVVSIHDGMKKDGKVVSYRNVARITDVVFKSNPLAALNIAAGEAKSTIGRMFGKFKAFEGANVDEQAENAKFMVNEIWKDRSWKQIGMNPTRASYFYDRASGRPVVAAEEVVQIGGLVYAKNPVFTRWNDPTFEVKGYNDVDGSPIYFSIDDAKPEASRLRRTIERTVNRFDGETRQRVLSNPSSYLTPQSVTALKDQLSMMADEELVENMTAEGLNRVANTANPGKGENDISVLAAVELINRKAEAGEDVSELLVDLAQLGTTVGRMLRHFAELKSSSPLGIVETIRAALKRGDRIMTDTQEKKLTDIADRFIKAQQKVKELRDELTVEFDAAKEAELNKSVKELDTVTRELNKFTSVLVPKKIADLLTTTIQGNLLTPISQVTNVFANLFQIALSIPVRTAETAGAKVYQLFTGKNLRSFRASISAIPYAMKRGGVGVVEALQTIIKGGASTEKIVHAGFVPGAAFLASMSDTKFAQAVNATFGKDVIKGDVLPRLANGKIAAADRAKALYEGVLGVAPEIMFRFLALGDKPFSRFSEAMQLYQEAQRLGLKGEALKTFLKYPTKQAMKRAEIEGKKLTFQQDNAAASAIFQFQKIVGKIPTVGKALEFALKVSLPYVKTPANIFTETLMFAIPGLGFARGTHRIYKGETSEGISDLAKAATGQMVIMAANYLIANGLIKGAFTDEDDEERALAYLQQPPMTINIDGLQRALNGGNPDWTPSDRYMRYDKMGIIGTIMGSRVTAIKNNLDDAKGKEEGYYFEDDKGFFEPFTHVWDVLGVPLATFQTLNQQSFLAGSSSLLKVLSGGASERDVDDWMVTTFRALTAIPFPNTLSAFSRVEREYMPDSKAQTVEGKFKYVLKDRLLDTDGMPARVDFLGNRIPQNPEGANKWIYNFVDPTKTAKSSDDKLVAEIYRLYQLNENPDVIPGFPTKLTEVPKKHPIDGVVIQKLSAERELAWRKGLEDLQVMYGQYVAERLTDLFASNDYINDTNENKEIRISTMLKDIRDGKMKALQSPVPGFPSMKRNYAWYNEYLKFANDFFAEAQRDNP